MKKFIEERKGLIIFTVIVFVLASVIFKPISNRDFSTDKRLRERDHLKYYTNVYVDPETGVNYLVYDDGYGGDIMLRYNTDGSVYVSEVE